MRGQDPEPLDGFGPGQLAVHPVHRVLDGCAQARVIAEVVDARPGRLAEPLLPPAERRLIQGDERGDIGPLVADDQALLDEPVLPQPVLGRAGRDVLAVCRDDQVFLPAGDEQEPVVVEPSEIAGAEPPAVERLGGGLRIPPVAAEHVRVPDLDLAAGRYPHGASGQQKAGRADPLRAGQIVGHRACRLGQAHQADPVTRPDPFGDQARTDRRDPAGELPRGHRHPPAVGGPAERNPARVAGSPVEDVIARVLAHDGQAPISSASVPAPPR